MRTSDRRIWAVGDAVEVRDFITGEWSLVPLAGPASRQGRVAADAIFGRKSRFRGVQGTMVCKVFDRTVAATGLTEKALRSRGSKLKYEKVYLHPNNHAGYYPGAESISIKLIFSTEDGRILGAQAIGAEGVERRIDVISMAIQKGATVYDLEEAEMCYAPQFGSTKDAVNIAGMVAANVLRGDSNLIQWEDLNDSGDYVLDVRDPSEFAAGHFPGATNIPLSSLRKRMAELPRDKEIAVYCATGHRSYYANRILLQNGFSVGNISGGMTTYRAKVASGNFKRSPQQ
jgi:rhodanese-related sulfurtransferase